MESQVEEIVNLWEQRAEPSILDIDEEVHRWFEDGPPEFVGNLRGAGKLVSGCINDLVNMLLHDTMTIEELPILDYKSRYEESWFAYHMLDYFNSRVPPEDKNDAYDLIAATKAMPEICDYMGMQRRSLPTSLINVAHMSYKRASKMLRELVVNRGIMLYALVGLREKLVRELIMNMEGITHSQFTDRVKKCQIGVYDSPMVVDNAEYVRLVSAVPARGADLHAK